MWYEYFTAITTAYFCVLTRLNAKHCVFGQVIEGMDIVKLMESQGTVNGEPHTEVVIVSCGME